MIKFCCCPQKLGICSEGSNFGGNTSKWILNVCSVEWLKWNSINQQKQWNWIGAYKLCLAANRYSSTGSAHSKLIHFEFKTLMFIRTIDDIWSRWIYIARISCPFSLKTEINGFSKQEWCIYSANGEKMVIWTVSCRRFIDNIYVW